MLSDCKACPIERPSSASSKILRECAHTSGNSPRRSMKEGDGCRRTKGLRRDGSDQAHRASNKKSHFVTS